MVSKEYEIEAGQLVKWEFEPHVYKLGRVVSVDKDKAVVRAKGIKSRDLITINLDSLSPLQESEVEIQEYSTPQTLKNPTNTALIDGYLRIIEKDILLVNAREAVYGFEKQGLITTQERKTIMRSFTEYAQNLEHSQLVILDKIKKG